MAEQEQSTKSQAPEATPEAEKKAKQTAPKSVLTQQDKREINKAVLTTETSVMNPIEYEQMRKMAGDFWNSSALPQTYNNPEQVFMAIQLGRQMGLTAHEAVLKGYYVDGRYQVWGSAIPGALRRHGWRWQFTDESDTSTTVKLTHSETNEEITDTYAFDDAKKSGFTTDRNGNLKFGWREGANRKRKLRYGVLSQVVNTYLPDVLGGVAEIAEYAEEYIEGQVIDDEKNDATKHQQDKINDKVTNFKPAVVNDTKPEVAPTN